MFIIGRVTIGRADQRWESARNGSTRDFEDSVELVACPRDCPEKEWRSELRFVRIVVR